MFSTVALKRMSSLEEDRERGVTYGPGHVSTERMLPTGDSFGRGVQLVKSAFRVNENQHRFFLPFSHVQRNYQHSGNAILPICLVVTDLFFS